MSIENIVFGIICVIAVGFGIYALYLLSKHYIVCDKCGGNVIEIGNNYSPECMLLGGYDTFYKCMRCGKTFTIHHYTYD